MTVELAAQAFAGSGRNAALTRFCGLLLVLALLALVFFFPAPAVIDRPKS
jgi:hypothetical protein